MADPDHVAVVREGEEAIEIWRRMNPRVRLNLRDADLSAAHLSGANLDYAMLAEADLSGADLSRARLTETNLGDAKLHSVNLEGAYLGRADFSQAKLINANLSATDLFRADFTFADLSNAKLTDANLGWSVLASTKLEGTDFANSTFGHGILVNLDLSTAKGLEQIDHKYMTLIDTRTLLVTYHATHHQFEAKFQDFFLAAGVPKRLLELLPQIVMREVYCSCFISYGKPDLTFARKLVHDLRTSGISCWLYEMDATVGKRMWEEIGEKRREADKMVILCSAEALVREGVLKEIEEQIDEAPDKLVPISLDDLWKEEGFKVMRGTRDLKPFLMERNYADFANLTYEVALERLLVGLRRKDS